MIGTILTTAIGIFAKGRASKAIASSVGGVVLGALGGPEIIGAFQTGVGSQLIEPAGMAGQVIGAAIGGGIQYILAYFAPRNAD